MLSDYKETVPENSFTFLHSHCSHVTDMLITFRQNHTSQALKMHAYMHCPSILTTFSMFSASAGSCMKKWLTITTPTTLLSNTRHYTVDTL